MPSTPHALTAAAGRTEALPGWMQGPWLSPARRFIGRKPARTQAENDLYDMLAETERAAATLAAKRRMGTLAPHDLERYGRDAAIGRRLGKETGTLSDMRRLADRIRRSDLPPAEKRARLDEARRMIRKKAMGLEDAVRRARES